MVVVNEGDRVVAAVFCSDSDTGNTLNTDSGAFTDVTVDVEAEVITVVVVDVVIVVVVVVVVVVVLVVKMVVVVLVVVVEEETSCSSLDDPTNPFRRVIRRGSSLVGGAEVVL